MNLINEQVQHKAFGDGKIIKQTDTTVTVEFSASHGVKCFLYPSVFSGFMEPINPDVKKQIEGELRKFRRKEKADKTRRDKEREERRLLEQQIRLEEKAAAKKRTAAAKKRTTAAAAKKKKS